MEGRKRQAGIELLRMVAMMMIVTMHFLANSGNLLEPGKPSDASAVLGKFLSCGSERLCVYQWIFRISGNVSGEKSPEVPLPDLVLQPDGSPCTDGLWDQHRLSGRHLWNPSLSVSD